MTGEPGWEAPLSKRRFPRWAWALAAGAAGFVAVQLAGAPDEPLPGLPVETVEEPVPRPVARTIPEPSDRWQPIPTPPTGEARHATAVWTGDELVVWDGRQTAGWSPATETWRLLAPAPVTWTNGWSATWTGAEVVYVSARDPAVLVYTPAEDRWRQPDPAPLTTRSPSVVGWDGARVHVWSTGEGAAFDPSTDRWTPLPPVPLSPRSGAAVRWLADTGELVVWGGVGAAGRRVDGAAFRPVDGTWRPLPEAPWAFRLAPAVTSDGRTLYAWGLPAEGLHLPSGMGYDAIADVWRELPDLLAQERAGAAAVLLGDEDLLVVWGGLDRRLADARTDGFVLHLPSGRWRQLPPAPIPGRRGAFVSWVDAAGAEGLLVWGGESEGLTSTDGAFYPGSLLREPVLGLTGPRTAEE